MKNTPRPIAWWIISTFLAIAVLGAAGGNAWAQCDWRTPGCQRQTVEGTRGSTSGSRDSSRSESSSSEDNEARRAERNRQYDVVYQQMTEAWKKGDYRTALRWLKQQQKLRNGPIVRESIEHAKALIVWTEATTAADYRRAIKMQPSLFTRENINYVEHLEAKEKLERERPEREARAEQARIKQEVADRIQRERDKTSVRNIQQSIQTFVQDLSAATSSSKLASGGVNAGSTDGRDQLNSVAGSGTDARGQPILDKTHRLAYEGFDTGGNNRTPPLVEIPRVPAAEVAPVIEERFTSDPQIVKFQSQWKAASVEKATAEKNLAELRESRKKPDANKEELDVKEVNIRLSIDTAKSKLATAVSNIVETVRVLTFKEQKID